MSASLVLANSQDRFQVLDGWRGLSILLVLATHLLPLGPKDWKLNLASGPLGMALFFTLSGFLIANFLIHNKSVPEFLVRRLFRIVHLAWLCMAIALVATGTEPGEYPANFLSYANLPPVSLTDANSHYWSLCVEMQFYFGIALLFLLMKDRGLLLVPALCLLVTVFRVVSGEHASIVTYFRVDEILVGSVLALVYNGRLGDLLPDLIKSANPYFLLGLLLVSCHPDSGAANYLRPYLAALLVGTTLYCDNTRLTSLLSNSTLSYIAAVSYALYVVHPLLTHTWLGGGDGVEKYLKRPLLFGAMFLCAHISTFYFEQRWIAYGKRLVLHSRSG